MLQVSTQTQLRHHQTGKYAPNQHIAEHAEHIERIGNHCSHSSQTAGDQSENTAVEHRCKKSRHCAGSYAKLNGEKHE